MWSFTSIMVIFNWFHVVKMWFPVCPFWLVPKPPLSHMQHKYTDFDVNTSIGFELHSHRRTTLQLLQVLQSQM